MKETARMIQITTSNGELRAYINTWLGKVEVPLIIGEKTFAIDPNFDFRVYDFGDNLAVF